MAAVLLISGIAGWVLGSIPMAYIVVRATRGIDLTAAGSTNVGANNAFTTTGSRAVGIAVLLLDALKGVVAVVLGMALASGGGDVGGLAPAYAGAAALLCAIAGHNYNLPLTLHRGRLAGGKGLATATGGFLLLAPWLVAIWAVLWVLGAEGFARLRGVRDAIPGNVLATSLIPLAGWALYGGFGLFVTLLAALLILPRHREQMRALLADPPVARG